MRSVWYVCVVVCVVVYSEKYIILLVMDMC